MDFHTDLLFDLFEIVNDERKDGELSDSEAVQDVLNYLENYKNKKILDDF